MIAIQTPNLSSDVVTYMPKATAFDSDAAILLPESDDPFRPCFPQTVDALGLSPIFLSDLVLKAIAMEPNCTSSEIAARLHMGLMATDQVLHGLTRDKLIEIKGVVGTHNHRYGMLERGWTEVGRVMAISS